MTQINVVTRTGTGHVLNVEAGLKVMQVLRDNDMGVLAICGGSVSCATCHIYVDADWVDRLPPAKDYEIDLIEDLEGYREGASRLSCQIVFTPELDGLKVTVAPEE